MILQNNAYLVIGYACNEKCRCCPLVHKDERPLITPFERIREEIDIMVNLGVTDVTISGGEPTLHPDFFCILEEFIKNNIAIHILSNGEMFSDNKFSDRFINTFFDKSVCITTTFHSNRLEEHERQNLTKGSFDRSLKGIRYLDTNGINVAIKHCITMNNYRELPQFLEWVLVNFSANTEIQLWGIDLCGVDESIAREVFVEFKEIGSYLTLTLDMFENSTLSHNRVLTINNLPLCMCDAYYWRYFSFPEADNYIEHLDNGRKMDAISGPKSKKCLICKFRGLCQGVYYSNFDVMGDDIVSEPVNETCIVNSIPQITFYDASKISLIFLSPYSQIYLSHKGFHFYNTITEEDVIFRLKSTYIKEIVDSLNLGIKEDELISMFKVFGLNGSEVVNELILKGIIE